MSSTTQIFDAIPVPLAFATFLVAGILVHEGGFQFGRYVQESTPEEKEGPTGLLVGAILALMAFLLATATGMASDRFDARRALVIREANDIGTTYLRAGYLDEPAATEIRNLLREYVPLRINVADPALQVANFQQGLLLLDQAWDITEQVARDHGDSEVVALFVEAMNATIDIGTERDTALIYGRVPQTVVVLLVLGAALSVLIVGYHSGLTRRRGFVSAFVLVLVLGSVLSLVIDLDRPRDGLLQVSQQPLRDLQTQIGPPTGG